MPGFSATGSDPVGSLPSTTSTPTPPPPDPGGDDPVPTFTPSSARTIKVGPASRAFTATTPGYWDMTNPKKPVGLKDPNATLDVTFDWTDWLADIGGVGIGQLEFLTANGVVVASSPPAVGGFATVVLTAGDPGEAPITCRITTDSTPTLIEDRTVILKIEER